MSSALRPSWSDLWRWDGEIDRGRYVLLGLLLFGLKHNVDRLIATKLFGLPWSPFNYLAASFREGWAPNGLYLALIAASLPFIWSGVVLTLRRLRAAGLPTWLAALFFVPYLNLLFFLAVGAAPPRATPSPPRGGIPFGEFIPRSALGSAAVAVLGTGLLAAAVAAVCAGVLAHYGWGLFVGNPFVAGVVAALIHGYHEPRGLGACLAAGAGTVAVAGGLLILGAVEGLVCVAMASPLALVLALLGAALGWFLQRRPQAAAAPLAALLLGAPLLMGAEYAAPAASAVLAITTAVVIDAPRETVWRNVVSFADLPAPKHWIFRFGFAYPVRATLSGRGVGAVRQCTFSTGSFVEPITAWDEPRLLRFSVTAQPPPMVETGLWGPLAPPHLDGFFSSVEGQFLLTELPGGKTRLDGTTWYVHKIEPSAYWSLWSDFVIHRIHGRVLDHIRALSEARGA